MQASLGTARSALVCARLPWSALVCHGLGLPLSALVCPALPCLPWFGLPWYALPLSALGFPAGRPCKPLACDKTMRAIHANEMRTTHCFQFKNTLHRTHPNALVTMSALDMFWTGRPHMFCLQKQTTGRHIYIYIYICVYIRVKI